MEILVRRLEMSTNDDYLKLKLANRHLKNENIVGEAYYYDGSRMYFKLEDKKKKSIVEHVLQPVFPGVELIF